MGKNLCIVIGAGASHDLIAAPPADVRNEWEPPLTSDIFASRFTEILNQYSDARSLAATIGIRTQRGEPLEAVLRDFSNSSEATVRRQFRQIPLYLQHLFGMISSQYTKEPINCTYLARLVLSSAFDRVAFVTLNYDLFLEKALVSIDRAEFNETGAYVDPMRKWMLVKLHGSVNWARSTPPGILNDYVGRSPLEFLQLIDVLPHLGEIEIRDYRADRWDGSSFKYPCLTVPVEGKYELSCPKTHVDALAGFLADCRNYLFIGVSARDKDLLDLLAKNVKIAKRLTVVGHGTGDGDLIRQRLHKFVSRFKGLPFANYDGGFSSFLTTGALDDFLADLV